MGADEDNARAGWGTAVVCGAGMAGLLTARVLSDFFEHVVIIERDTLTDEPVPRRGVPQAPHVHFLLAGGQLILADLFPGFVEEMTSHGAQNACVTSSRKRYQVDRWAPRFDSDLWWIYASRGLLEWAVRRRVIALPNVELRTECRVAGVITSNGNGAVCGVQTRSANGSDDNTAITPADLVVDATGRTSAGPKWLDALGYQSPNEITVNGFWAYASRSYRMPEDWDPDWSALVTLPSGQPGHTRGAALVKQESGRWLLTLLGCANDHPTSNEQALLEWIGSLPVPDFADAIASATPLTEISVWRQTFNRLRRYEQLARRPEGLLFVGDTVCTLNPVYGQGMSVAALGARELRTSLIERSNAGDGLSGFAEQFQRILADSIRFSWVISSCADSAIPGAVGDSPGADEVELGRRWGRALRLSSEDPEVFRLFWETVMMVTPPDWLYHGDIADRINAAQELTPS